MNSEFHYYVTYWLAVKGGFSDADAAIIAMSSKLTDDRISAYKISCAGGTYNLAVTQGYGFWNQETAVDIYAPFHFIPGNSCGKEIVRKDGKKNKLDVAADSPIAKKLLIAALKTRNLYRIGIAIHAYADTWAHQGFSCRRESWNCTDLDSLIPAVGHAQVMNLPDQLEKVWYDPRMLSPLPIVNRERWYKAALKIYKYLRTYNTLSFDTADVVLANLADIWTRDATVQERRLDYFIDCNAAEQNPNAWYEEVGLSSSFDTMVDRSGVESARWLRDELFYRTNLMKQKKIILDERFLTSNLYRWSESAYEHRNEAANLFAAEHLF